VARNRRWQRVRLDWRQLWYCLWSFALALCITGVTLSTTKSNFTSVVQTDLKFQLPDQVIVITMLNAPKVFAKIFFHFAFWGALTMHIHNATATYHRFAMVYFYWDAVIFPSDWVAVFGVIAAPDETQLALNMLRTPRMTTTSRLFWIFSRNVSVITSNDSLRSLFNPIQLDPTGQCRKVLWTNEITAGLQTLPVLLTTSWVTVTRRVQLSPVECLVVITPYENGSGWWRCIVETYFLTMRTNVSVVFGLSNPSKTW